MNLWAKSVLLGLAILYCGRANACCENITIAVLTERSALVDFPSQLNRTIGLIERAMNKTREILQHVANVEFIIKNMDFPGCTDSHWGALLAELYYVNQINAIVGPGMYFQPKLLLVYCTCGPVNARFYSHLEIKNPCFYKRILNFNNAF